MSFSEEGRKIFNLNNFLTQIRIYLGLLKREREQKQNFMSMFGVRICAEKGKKKKKRNEGRTSTAQV